MAFLVVIELTSQIVNINNLPQFPNIATKSFSQAGTVGKEYTRRSFRLPGVLILEIQEAEAEHNDQADEVCCGEDDHELADLRFGPCNVEFQGNQACQRGDGRAQTAHIDTGQHICPLL